MNTQNTIEQFQSMIAEFYKSRLIVVEVVISSFLERLVKTPALYAVVEDATRRANYEAQYSRAVTRDSLGCYFTLPANKRQTVSLVTGLLFDFDRYNLSIVEFVTKFFPSATSHGSYLAFCDNVIKPYGEAFTALLAESEPQMIRVAEENDAPLLPFAEKAKEDADYWLKALLDTLTGDNHLEEDLRREAVTVVKGMLSVLELGNPMLIKVVWIGLKHTLGTYSCGLRELKEIETILRTYGVIE